MKILIIRFSSLGDIVLTTPVIAYLKNRNPKAIIHYVTKSTFKEILEENPYIDQLIELKDNSIFSLARLMAKTDPAAYDIVFDLHNSLRSNLFTMLIKKRKIFRYKKPYLKRWFLVYFKKNLFKKIDEVPYLYIKEYKADLIKLKSPVVVPVALEKKNLSGWNDKKITLAIAPGARWFTKKWPVENFINVIHQYHSENPKTQIVLLGGKDEKDTSRAILAKMKHKKNIYDFTGKLSIRESAFVLSKCKSLLTNDSGLMHVAAAFDTKIIALFLSTVPEFGFQPFTKNKFVLSEKISCKPCDHKGLPKCPKKHFKCALHIKPDDVLNVLKKAMK